MALIPCSDNCIYQNDGYCQLDVSSIITNSNEGSCVHKIERDDSNSLFGTDSIKGITYTSYSDNLNI